MSAFALLQPAFAASPTPMYMWNGLYLGGHGGAGWGSSHWIDDPQFGSTDLLSHDLNGAFGGGQIGYNWQLGSWVIGVEASGSFADLKGQHIDPLLSDLHTKVDGFGTFAARGGYAFDHVLIYAKIGAGWEHAKYDDYAFAGGPLNGANTSTRWTYVWGVGAEYAFMPHWSVFVEFDRFDFPSETLSFNGGIGGPFVQEIDDQVNVIKGGVNYLFNM